LAKIFSSQKEQKGVKILKKQFKRAGRLPFMLLDRLLAKR
jgi:hypothetical protein